VAAASEAKAVVAKAAPSSDAELFWPMCQYSGLTDTNGVVYFLGSGLGLDGAFRDPVEAEALSVTVSANRSGLHVKNFVGRENLNDQHFIDGSSSNPPWFAVNFQQWYVQPYCYKLRCHSSDFPSSWELQGRRDQGAWTTLDAHDCDESFNSQTAMACLVFPMFGSASTFNNFRIILTGPAQGLYQPAHDTPPTSS